MSHHPFIASVFCFLATLGAVTPTSAADAEARSESAETSTAATEQRISELLKQDKCQDAISELHRVYSQTPAPRLRLWYGRSFRQCQDPVSARTAYEAVLGARQPVFSVDELEEARLVVIGRRMIENEDSIKASAARAKKASAQGLMIGGGIMLAGGLALGIGGASVASQPCSAGAWCIGPPVVGALIGGTGLVALVIPGAVMLGVGIHRYRKARSK